LIWRTLVTDSEGGEARNHEAEVEAVARVLHDYLPLDDYSSEAVREVAGDVLDALRRCPQGEDPALRPGVPGPIDVADERRIREALSPQGEDHEATHPYAEVALGPEEFVTSDQGEDHEARLQGVTRLIEHPNDSPRLTAMDVLAYLSRCPSPERDPRTPDEFIAENAALHARLRNTEKLVEALRETIGWTYGEECTPERRDEIERLLAEFSSTTKEQ